MATIVTDVDPTVSYTATSGQTAFAVPFNFFADADLVVEVAGVTKTLTTHYTVAGAGDDDGGTVTLLTGATLGDDVTITRSINIERTTHFPTSGPFDIEELNDQLSKIFAILQEQAYLPAGAVAAAEDAETAQAAAEAAAAEAAAYSSAQSEAVQDVVGAMAAASGTGLSVAYDDGAGTVTYTLAQGTTSARGALELATDAETAAGTDTARPITPSNLTAVQVAFRAHLTSTQVVTTGATGEKIELGSETIDTHGYFNTSTYRFTPLVAGKYHFFGTAELGSTVDLALYKVAIYKNGSLVAAGALRASGAGGQEIPQVSSLVSMNGSTDYVELWFIHGQGSDHTINNGSVQTWFEGYRVAP